MTAGRSSLVVPSSWVFTVTAWRDGSEWRFRILAAELHDDVSTASEPRMRYSAARGEVLANLSDWLDDIGATGA